MKIAIPKYDYLSHMFSAINTSKPGDVIVVNTEEQKQLGERAKGRMCPDKDITFEVKDE